MTKSYDIYTDLYLCYMNVIYVYMMLKIHADISICICMYDLINTGTYEHSGSLMIVHCNHDTHFCFELARSAPHVIQRGIRGGSLAV